MSSDADYTRNVLRLLIPKKKPFIVSGIYQKRQKERSYITFVDIKPHIPRKTVEKTLCSHLNVMIWNLEEVCSNWQELLEDGEQYILVCFSKPYRDENLVKRCSVKLTNYLGVQPILPYTSIALEDAYDRNLCVSWETFMGGSWAKQDEQKNKRIAKKVAKAKRCYEINKVLRTKID